MKQSRVILIATLIFCSLNSYASKDRIERPEAYTFIFNSNDTVVFKNPKDSLLKSYTDDILTHKRILTEAILRFKTGEVLTFKLDKNRWTIIKVKINNKEIEVPEKTLHKISEIHFQSVALLWNGLYESPTAAGNFYVQFDIGIKKSFDKYPYLQLFFNSKKYEVANIWRQTDERSKQWSTF